MLLRLCQPKKAIHLQDEVCWSMQCLENVLENFVEHCLQVEEDSTMAQTKQASKRRRRKKALPVIGIAGVSLSLAGGAYASTVGSTTDIQSQNISPRHEVFIGEEEITDVSLGTFYVFDKENAAKPRLGEQLAWWRGCGGCRCGGCGYAGCGGCGGCGGCAWCASRGGCHYC
jgi:hypothetical protein